MDRILVVLFFLKNENASVHVNNKKHDVKNLKSLKIEYFLRASFNEIICIALLTTLALSTKTPLITCSSWKIKFTLATLNKAHHLWVFFLLYPIQFIQREINRKIYKTLNLIVTLFYHHNTKYILNFSNELWGCVLLREVRMYYNVYIYRLKSQKYLFQLNLRNKFSKNFIITFRIFNV